MTVQHHPSDETLLRFAAGTLTAGIRLVVGVHVDGCPRCGVQVGCFEAIGGAMLDEAVAAAEGIVSSKLKLAFQDR